MLPGFCSLSGSFSVDFEEGEESYTYVFQLCGDAGGVPSAGVVQIDKKSPSKHTVIGRYNTTRVIGGSKTLLHLHTDYVFAV